MATFDVGHPDVLDFIRAKREDGRLRQFNLSLLITREFIEAVRADEEWPLAFPVASVDELGEIVWRNVPNTGNYVTNAEGLVACKVYRTLPARRLWDLIMASHLRLCGSRVSS